MGQTYVYNNLHENGSFCGKKVLNTALKLFELSHTDTLNPHSISELHEVGITLVSPGESILVYKMLVMHLVHRIRYNSQNRDCH